MSRVQFILFFVISVFIALILYDCVSVLIMENTREITLRKRQ
jgi:hypothetical protein